MKGRQKVSQVLLVYKSVEIRARDKEVLQVIEDKEGKNLHFKSIDKESDNGIF